jgi:SAM-dependent methyltransferase
MVRFNSFFRFDLACYLIRSGRTKEPNFTFNSEKLRYFFHSYNNFGVSERAIEVPIIKSYLDRGNYENILEIGNVTNHYYDYFRLIFSKSCKVVVDKYEIGNGVINKDISEYISDNKFDFIFSISTFEHMDGDLGLNPEDIKKPTTLGSIAADNVKYVGDFLLKPGGKLVITAPLDYTPEWPECIFSNIFSKCGFSEYNTYLFRRKTAFAWEQVDVSEGSGACCTPKQQRKYLSVVEFIK